MRALNALHQLTSDQIDETDDIDSSPSPPPAQDSTHHILNALDDHCLCEIFQSFEHVADFDAIANVCQRFNRIARRVFPTKISMRLIHFNFDDLVFDDGVHFNFITLSQIETFLINFGSSIFSLQFRPYYLEPIPNAANSALKLIHKYCKNIGSLNIELYAEQNQISDELQSIFSKLLCFNVRFLQYTPDRTFLSTCTKVEQLHVFSYAKNCISKVVGI